MRNIINISLPKELADQVKREVKKGKFSTTSEFFRHILRERETIELLKEIEESKRDWDNGKKNWKSLRSLKDLR